jgi:hypothetical protein
VFAEPPAFAEPPEPVDDGLLLHAAASRPRAAVAMMAAAVRAVRGDARRGRRMTRVLSFMMPSSGAGPWLRLVAGVHRDRLLSGDGPLRPGGPRRRGLSGVASSA